MRANGYGSRGWLLSVALLAALSACSSAQTSPATAPDSPSTQPSEQVSAVPAQPEPARPVGDIPTPRLPGSEEPGQAAPADGPSGDCGNRKCEAPEQCIEYVGVAGPSVPLYTCGILCRDGASNQGCPAGYSCESVPDGPRMCRKP
jgi:hypothetical protein